LQATTSVSYAYSLRNSSLALPGVNTSVGLPPEGASGFVGGLSEILGPTDPVGTSVVSMDDVHTSSGEALGSGLVRLSLAFNGSSSSSAGECGGGVGKGFRGVAEGQGAKEYVILQDWRAGFVCGTKSLPGHRKMIKGYRQRACITDVGLVC
jgi:hypothetical protein